MPGPIASYINGKSKTPKAAPTLREKVVYANQNGWLNLMPWIQDERSPYKRRAAYRQMLHHDAVKAPLLQKIYSVSSLDIQATAASESPRDQEIADFVRYQFTDAIDGEFPQVAESILLPALLTKNSVSEKVWHQEPWRRGRFNGKRFYRTIKTKENVTLTWDKFRNIDGIEGVDEKGDTVRWDPRDFVIFRNLPLFEDEGTSDLEAVYDLVWMLDTIQKIHNIHLEKFTSPATVGTFQAGSEAVDPDTGETVPMQDALRPNLEAFRSRNWLIVPDTVKVEALSLATRGEAEFLAACDSYRQRIALAIAGAYLQMMAQGGPGEMRGNAAGAKSTAELFVWALAAKLASTLNTQAVPSLVDMNYQAADYPKLSLGGVNYAELLQAIQLEEIAQRMGQKLSAKAHSRKYGLQTATDPTDVLTPSAPPGGAAGQGFFQQFADHEFYSPDQPRDDQGQWGEGGAGGGKGSKAKGFDTSKTNKNIDEAQKKHPHKLGTVQLSDEQIQYFKDKYEDYKKRDPAGLKRLESLDANWGNLPPILVAMDDESWWVMDGDHRLTLAVSKGITEIPAYIPVTKKFKPPPGIKADFAEPETFAETPEVPGPDHTKAEQFLSAALKQGAAKLQSLCRRALERHGEGVLEATELFSDEEREALADQIAATSATAELLGRARIREREQQALRRHEFAAHRFYEPDQPRADDGRFGNVAGDKKPSRYDPPKRRSLADHAKALNLKFERPDTPEFKQPNREQIEATTLGVLKGSTREAVIPTYSAYTGNTEIYVGDPNGKYEQRAIVAPGQRRGDVDISGFDEDGRSARSISVPAGLSDEETRYRIGVACSIKQPKELLEKYGKPKDWMARDERKTFSDVPFHTFDEAALTPLAPTRAIEYFRKLVPTLSIPEGWAAAIAENAFTIAGVAELTILERIKSVIQGRLETWEDTRGAVREIDALLDEAGLTERNPQRAEAIWRTEMMGAYRHGAEEEGLEVAETFPVHQVLNPDDGRSRPKHAARNRKFYRNARGSTLSEIIGDDPADIIQCRCTSRYVDRFEWAELEAAGATVEEAPY